MLLKLSDQITVCLAHAAEARERANATTDPSRKADFLDMELRWLRLVESCRFVEQASRFLEDSHAARSRSLAEPLGVLVHAVIENTAGEARAAFYVAHGSKLYHVTGMPEAYARQVDGFVIGPQSLACGLAAAKGKPIITPDVTEEPLWKPWLSLAEQFDYRACWSFPVETSTGKIVGTFAMYYKKPREITPRELDLAATITRAAAPIMISQL